MLCAMDMEVLGAMEMRRVTQSISGGEKGQGRPGKLS